MAKEEIVRFEPFFFCQYVFNNASAAEASKSVYMRVKGLRVISSLGQIQETSCPRSIMSDLVFKLLL